MSFRSSPEVNPNRIRIRNADGTVNIHCSICGHFICRMNPIGITTSICVYCQTGKKRPTFIDPQEELLMEIFAQTDEPATLEKKIKPKKTFNILDLAWNGIKALAYGRIIPKEETAPVEYAGLDESSAKEIAKRKRAERTPIFGKKK